MTQQVEGKPWTQQSQPVQIPRKSLGEILLESTTITEEQLNEALKNQQSGSNQKIGEILIKKEYVSEEDMLRALSIQLNLPYYDRLPVNDIDPSLVEDIPIQFCRDNQLLPVAKDSRDVSIAVSDPLNLAPIDDLRLILSTNINLIVCSPTVILNSINRVYERSNDASQKVIDELSDPEDGEVTSLEETRDLLESSDDEKPIIRLVNGLLARAVKERASDIHIEPYENDIVVRFRVDGSLQDKMQLPKRHAGSLASRIKIIGKLNIAEKRVPQDGRISIRVAGKDIDVRLSVLPTAFGERIVMRLLDKSSGAKSLAQMNISPDIFPTWLSLIEKKHGIVLVTGPTGSGKTTLLYASMVHINTSDINILTIEDPIEYQLAGVGQMEVKEKIGLTFSEGLRSILRQDPDVIMIGEIRDSTTANIAIQSSLTGHLVFSTLHTNDSASTVTRLMDFDIQPFQVTSALLGVMATRLVRRLCQTCRQGYIPTKQELATLGRLASKLDGRKLYRPGSGCEQCFQQCYRDRLGIHELLVIDDKMRQTIIAHQDAKIIKKTALESGMLTLRESALMKAIDGLTSIEEALQKTQTDRDDS
ncbi:MAG: type II secretion system ATPase GspE [Pseudomonadota bacterium]|nr:type II secretion system ATPase GspE [Pseudomonadota bacterium]